MKTHHVGLRELNARTMRTLGVLGVVFGSEVMESAKVRGRTLGLVGWQTDRLRGF